VQGSFNILLESKSALLTLTHYSFFILLLKMGGCKKSCKQKCCKPKCCVICATGPIGPTGSASTVTGPTGADGPTGPVNANFFFNVETSTGPTGAVTSGPIPVFNGGTLRFWSTTLQLNVQAGSAIVELEETMECATVASVGAMFTTVQDAVVAGFRRICVIGAASEVSNVTLSERYYEILVGDGIVWTTGSFVVVSPSTVQLNISGGLISSSRSVSGDLFDLAAGSEIELTNTNINNSGSTAAGARICGSTSIELKARNIIINLPNFDDCGISNLVNSNSVLADSELNGGGTSCTRAINWTSTGALLDHVTLSGTFAPPVAGGPQPMGAVVSTGSGYIRLLSVNTDAVVTANRVDGLAAGSACYLQCTGPAVYETVFLNGGIAFVEQATIDLTLGPGSSVMVANAFFVGVVGYPGPGPIVETTLTECYGLDSSSIGDGTIMDNCVFGASGITAPPYATAFLSGGGPAGFGVKTTNCRFNNISITTSDCKLSNTTTGDLFLLSALRCQLDNCTSGVLTADAGSFDLMISNSIFSGIINTAAADIVQFNNCRFTTPGSVLVIPGLNAHANQVLMGAPGGVGSTIVFGGANSTAVANKTNAPPIVAVNMAANALW
jgi:hypothetical protein